MRIPRPSEEIRMIANQCDLCDGEKITFPASCLSEIMKRAAETIERQGEEIEKSTEKIMFLLDMLTRRE